MDTHQPLPGITVGDIGPKFGRHFALYIHASEHPTSASLIQGLNMGMVSQSCCNNVRDLPMSHESAVMQATMLLTMASSALIISDSVSLLLSYLNESLHILH